MCMDYYNLAIKRESTRSFKRRPVSDKQLAELSGYFPQCARLLPEIETDIRILGAEVCSLLKGCAGYHDLMIEAPNYLVIASRPEAHYLENAGYMGEDLVLKMTELEIETSHPTTIDHPVYEVDGILHYAVDNTPALFPITVSRAFSKLLAPMVDLVL